MTEILKETYALAEQYGPLAEQFRKLAQEQRNDPGFQKIKWSYPFAPPLLKKTLEQRDRDEAVARARAHMQEAILCGGFAQFVFLVRHALAHQARRQHGDSGLLGGVVLLDDLRAFPRQAREEIREIPIGILRELSAENSIYDDAVPRSPVRLGMPPPPVVPAKYRGH